MIAAASIVHTPQHLAGLCREWQEGDREVWLTLTGQGMAPALTPGFRLKVRCEAGRMDIGEIMAYRREGRIILHRLVAVVDHPESGQLLLIFRGDANREPDPAVPLEAVLGTVVAARKPSPLWHWRMRFQAWLNRHQTRSAPRWVQRPPLEGTGR